MPNDLQKEFAQALSEAKSIDQLMADYVDDRRALDEAKPVLLAGLMAELEALDRRRDYLENAIMKLIRRPRTQIEIVEPPKESTSGANSEGA